MWCGVARRLFNFHVLRVSGSQAGETPAALAQEGGGTDRATDSSYFRNIKNFCVNPDKLLVACCRTIDCFGIFLKCRCVSSCWLAVQSANQSHLSSGDAQSLKIIARVELPVLNQMGLRDAWNMTSFLSLWGIIPDASRRPPPTPQDFGCISFVWGLSREICQR